MVSRSNVIVMSRFVFIIICRFYVFLPQNYHIKRTFMGCYYTKIGKIVRNFEIKHYLCKQNHNYFDT